MSNLINDFNKKRINNLKSLYNTYLSILNRNQAIEIKSINYKFLFKQKATLINEINKKYNQLRLSLKSEFDKEIHNILKEQSKYNNLNSVQYSNKKALIIGINYNETSLQLNGCINDAKLMERFLKNRNFTEIKLLTDETEIKPTKDNILKEIKNILENSNKNDLIFIFYSGHGSYTIDRNNDELDGYDELLVPLDFDYIKDDELKQLINTYGKQDTNIIALFDCCNSGTSFDLRYQILDKLNYDDITENKANTETPCNIFYISGCRDDEYSIETNVNDDVQGLMTWAFLDIMNKNNKLSWRQLIKKMRENIKGRSFQIPQLSSGKLFNPDSIVSI